MTQAIIWTNAEQIHWHIYMPIGEDKLSQWLVRQAVFIIAFTSVAATIFFQNL